MDLFTLQQGTLLVQAGQAILFSDVAKAGMATGQDFTAGLFCLVGAIIGIADIVECFNAGLTQVAFWEDGMAVTAFPGIEGKVLFLLVLLELAAGEAEVVGEGLALPALLSLAFWALEAILGVVLGHAHRHGRS